MSKRLNKHITTILEDMLHDANIFTYESRILDTILNVIREHILFTLKTEKNVSVTTRKKSAPNRKKTIKELLRYARSYNRKLLIQKPITTRQRKSKK